MDTNATTARAGYKISEWIASVGMSHSRFYTLPSEIKPAAVKVGTRTIITEAPAAWLGRVAEMQRATQKAA